MQILKYISAILILVYVIFSFVIDGKGETLASNSIDSSQVKITLKALFPKDISESSGLIYTDGNLWTHNDRGGYPWIFNIDTTTGKIKQTVIVDNFPNTDWEDVTADKDHIYIGDFGNNYGMRRDLKILIIDKASITERSVVHVKATAINFSYTDQFDFERNNLNNFDCESMLCIGDSIYLFSKGRGDNQTRVYRMLKTPGNYRIGPYTSFNVNGRICGASYDPKNKKLALIGYMIGTTHSFMWLMSDFKGTDFFTGNKRRIEIGSGRLSWKTEGIAFENANRIFISCETSFSQRAGLFVCEIN